MAICPCRFYWAISRTLFIKVGTHSKWSETSIIKSITAIHMIQLMQEIFACNGIPMQMVLDNSPQFTLEVFATFMKEKKIRHSFSSISCSPKPVGLALCTNFKIQAMGQGALLEKKLLKFLLMYINTRHATAGKNQALMFMKRTLQCKVQCN